MKHRTVPLATPHQRLVIPPVTVLAFPLPNAGGGVDPCTELLVGTDLGERDAYLVFTVGQLESTNASLLVCQDGT